MAWFALQAAVTGILLAGGAVAARPWFTELNIAWITVAQDERTAALIHLGIATVVLLLVSALPAAKVHRNPDIEYHSTQHSSGSNRFGPRVRIAAV